MQTAKQANCAKVGITGISNFYTIARNFAVCHIVSILALVNAGHPVRIRWKFALVGGSIGTVRHNFQASPRAI